ncbi:Tol-Pal system beta propeller repeat protein TolB [Sphingomonas sp. ASV193]|uniref:Tol-Pal system beta propeller repeat protein TolB n=1 Tax=Sphingomonas sp. ASV193 TaxID=3144405 RepID=UPI0032E92F7D
MLTAVALAMPALAQDAAPQPGQPVEVSVTGGTNAPSVIAVPVFAPAAEAQTTGGSTSAIGQQIAQVIASDLRSTGKFNPVGPDGIPAVGYAEAPRPSYARWTSVGASTLLTGFVEARQDGRLTVGCYLFDLTGQSELTHQGYAVDPTQWRQAAHKCSDMAYSRLTGNQAYLDTRVVYVAETGPKDNRVKRIAIMDADGSNQRFLTGGNRTVITPRFSPDGSQLVYTSYIGRKPRVILLNTDNLTERLLIPGDHISFAPRFSPDGRQVVFSMAQNGNTDLYSVSLSGGAPRRLTVTPGADTAASYSPDGRKIVFESDRSGTQQLYVMNADGSDQRRISFGGGRYASPAWSPKGDLIAFTKIGAGFRIGVMSPSGGGEKLLTDAWDDEQPSWAPNGQFVMFNRISQGSGASRLYAVSVDGGDPRLLPTPTGGSDPSWSPLN